MKLSPEDLSFVVRSIRRYFPKEEFQLKLFGSYATGTARPASDIDIAVIGAGPIPAGAWQALEGELEESDFPKKVDIVDYHRVSGEFQRIIDRDGILI